MVDRKEMTPQVEQQIWALADSFLADSHLRSEASPQEQIHALQTILQGFDRIEADYVPDQVYNHKRLNIVGDALQILLAHPDAVDQSASLALSLATDGLARIPRRFAKNTPFGSACTEVWRLAHEAIYRNHPQRTAEWDAAFEAFLAAANDAAHAPRTHSEGSLRSAKRHNDLFALGRTMPWMSLI